VSHKNSTHYEWADKAKTIVRRVRIDYPVNLAELQAAIDEVNARIAQLPEPEPHPTKEEYKQKWERTGRSYEEVCEMIDKANAENPDVQERIELEATIKPQLEKDHAKWWARAEKGRDERE